MLGTHPNRPRRAEEIALALVTLLLCSLFLVPIFLNGFPLTHEIDSYPLRLAGLFHAFAEGQWDGRWLSDFSLGYGYPFFNYYPTGYYYLSALFHLAGLSYALSTLATVAAFSLLGSAGAYFLGRALWKNPSAGFVTALLWTYFPYRILNLYVRGDFAELSAMSLMPWALLGHLGLLRGKGRAALLLAAFAQAGILSLHNISALIFQAFVIGFVGLFALAEGLGAWRAWPRIVASQLLALGLGAAFWMPALLEKNLVHIESMVYPDSPLDVRNQLLWPSQLFKTGWDWGQALPGLKAEVSFQLGWATLAGLALGLAGALLHGIRRSHAGRRLLALAVLALAVLFLVLHHSYFFWDHVRFARFVQFPWRILLLAALALSLIGGAGGYLFEALPRRFRWLAIALVGLAVPGVVWAYLQPADWYPLKDKALEDKIRTEYVTTAARNEYLPTWAPYFSPPPNRIVTVPAPGGNAQDRARARGGDTARRPP